MYIRTSACALYASPDKTGPVCCFSYTCVRHARLWFYVTWLVWVYLTCLCYGRVVSRSWMSHVTNDSWFMCTSACALYASPGKTGQSCHCSKRVVSRSWMSHVTHESWCKCTHEYQRVHSMRARARRASASMLFFATPQTWLRCRQVSRRFPRFISPIRCEQSPIHKLKRALHNEKRALYINWKEPYIMRKEPHIMRKELT